MLLDNRFAKLLRRGLACQVASIKHTLLQGFWREHYSVRYPDLNGDPNYIANQNRQPDQGCSISVDIAPQGTITVANDRNRFRKVYHARGM